MVGLRTLAGEKEGLIIYQDDKEIFLDKIECGRLKNSIDEARRKFWKRFRLAPMMPIAKKSRRKGADE